MNSPEDEIPLPSEPVLSDEETIKQLRADSVRQYTERITFLEGKASRASELESQLEGVSSSLLVANKNLDAAKSECNRQASAIYAAHAILLQMCNSVNPSVLAIRRATDILDKAL